MTDMGLPGEIEIVDNVARGNSRDSSWMPRRDRWHSRAAKRPSKCYTALRGARPDWVDVEVFLSD